MLAQTSAGDRVNHAARARVIEYYAHCWNDYRVLWRTDENASVHFGFFDASTQSVGNRLRPVAEALVGLAAASAGGFAAAFGRREAALRWLQVAARGRAGRHDAAQRKMTAECAQAVGLRRDSLVLDAGCGVGGTDLWLAETYGVRVHGVNIQPLHLREARRNASRHPASARVRFSMQDFSQMAIAGASVDVVWALESVCHAADKQAFVEEAYRVLRPGGRLMMADFFLASDEVPPQYTDSMRVWTEGWALQNLASVAGIVAMAAARGFHDIVSRDIRPHVLPSSRRLYKASLVARPINTVLEGMGVRSSVAGANVRAAFHQYRPLRDGIWTYAIVTATK